ncbi:hypothetical protein 1 [Hubei tombus-like virus 31]|uniref:hypothetical protein 1 n=1 Tax=Hubei tombus-like virus 31 TaxID=1923279 RepID=UPI00090B5484|nr:hypothetical protein 1 [Hubei tombus-like virus 31]APG76509.1 hypothetical protein 1 [Hubei tombus-like virus 31]
MNTNTTTHERTLKSGIVVKFTRSPGTLLSKDTETEGTIVTDGWESSSRSQTVSEPTNLAAALEPVLTKGVVVASVVRPQRQAPESPVLTLRAIRRGTRAGRSVRRSAVFKELQDYPLSWAVIEQLRILATEICLGKELNVENFRIFVRKFEDKLTLTEVYYSQSRLDSVEDILWDEAPAHAVAVIKISDDRLSATRSFRLGSALEASLPAAAYRDVANTASAVDDMFRELYLLHNPGVIERRNIQQGRIEYGSDSWLWRGLESVYYGSAARWNWLVGKQLAVPTAPQC